MIMNLYIFVCFDVYLLTLFLPCAPVLSCAALYNFFAEIPPFKNVLHRRYTGKRKIHIRFRILKSNIYKKRFVVRKN
jgi:hypothetical protein